MDNEPPIAPGTLIVCGLLGMLVALVGSFLQQASWFGLRLGVFVALAASGLIFLIAGWALSSRRGAICAGATWLVTVFLLASWPRPEGDLIFIPRLWASELWLYGGPILAVAAAVLPYHQFGHAALQRGEEAGDRSGVEAVRASTAEPAARPDPAPGS